ncbi:hypothetical protein I3843_10G145000 [Carya illinoinensis]|uniref:Legume lectin domain-containing protein n=1 Tax=Carya illinoinensis TaxID=32201 RepID=A0A8T1P843_CARIL|nr:L-type lectin-domain containing receptor kinase VIII.1-like [Carya illinoinensis]KAG2685955.1 hypothetical protein I3760_10G152000 [Carya illinoinensis]KAG6640159.1 hypothetical protein CIPAW_10G153300 [Carya illinoinensis]KAG6693129.1 hypothetical protein I3842_10G150900 [Carya illinoinensis]KAG7960807.1 hypothetical protein I3843_10G145000 [Carya illinoinensis]
MAALSISGHLAALSFFILFFESLAIDPDSSFSFTRFENDSIIESKIALYGDAKVVDGGFQLTGPASSRAGRVMYKSPIKLVEGNSRNLVSFSTYFSFSMSTGNGDDLDFLMVPSGFNISELGNTSSGLSLGSGKTKIKVVAVKFYTLRDDTNGLVKNHVGIGVGSFVSEIFSKASAYNLSRSSGKAHAWIDYEAGSKRIEVRLSDDGHSRPSGPLLSYRMDLSKVCEDEKVFVGFSSSSRNSSSTCFLHSWTFRLRHVPNWMHSEPLDPKAFAKSTKTLAARKSCDCLSRLLAMMIFGAACGALAAFTVLYLWTIFGHRRPVVPEEEFSMQPMDCDCKKVGVVVEKAIKDGK